jgi:hypothetical protein
LGNRAKFCCANRGEILGVGEQNSPLIPNSVMKLNAAMIGFGGKVWNNIINANTHGFSPFCDMISST